ncbi:MAG: ABC transporter substrate-binding protein [Chloroflexota bacterium]
MRTPRALVGLALVAAIAAACTSSSAASPAPSAAATPVPSTAPTAAPSAAPSEAAASPTTAPTPAPTENPCAPAKLTLKTAGKLTIGTDNPAYPPYFAPSDPNPKPWELGDPTNQQGFEAATAYAVAAKLGFTPDQVVWTVVPFDNSYKPGAKPFDFYIGQVSYTEARAKAVDMSDGYYFVNQSIVAMKGSPLEKVTNISGMKDFKFGAQVGTTAYDTIVNTIAPNTKPGVYNTNDAAIKALQAKQIDGLVVDLPTAFYVTAAQIVDKDFNPLASIVGQFPAQQGADAEHFSLVLTKDSPLTACVNGAVQAITADGSLAQITQTWLADKANAPVIQP